MASSTQTANHFLSLRLDESDAALMQTLYCRTGLSKTEIVKLALRKLANETLPETSLFDMGASKFGRYGDARRQSTQIKSVVRERIAAKRTREK
jgi:Ribbon-helix-helix protein, copG family